MKALRQWFLTPAAITVMISSFWAFFLLLFCGGFLCSSYPLLSIIVWCCSGGSLLTSAVIFIGRDPIRMKENARWETQRVADSKVAKAKAELIESQKLRKIEECKDPYLKAALIKLYAAEKRDAVDREEYNRTYIPSGDPNWFSFH